MNTNEPLSPSNTHGIDHWIPLEPPAYSQHENSAAQSPLTPQPELGEYRLIFTYPPRAEGTLFHVDCTAAQAQELSLEAGEYTLLRSDLREQLTTRSLERFASLEVPESIAPLATYRPGSATTEHWYSTTGACTLKSLLGQRTQLTPGDVTALAEDLANALTWAHQHQFAYHGMTTDHILITLNSHAQLLAPLHDYRGALPHLTTQHIAADTRTLATLIWLMLTGEKPKDGVIRKPLSLSVPEAPAALARVLELALDAPAETIPQLNEITTALAAFAKPTRMQLHDVVPPEMSGRLPAVFQTPVAPPRANKKRPVIPAATRTLQPKKTMLGSELRKKKLLLPLAAGVAILGISSGIMTFMDSEPDTVLHTEPVVDAPVVDQEADNHQPPGDLTPAGNAPPAEPTRTPENTESIAISEDIAAVIDKRNRVLGSGNADAVTSYAVADSPVAKADTDLIAADTQRVLDQQPLTVSAVQDVVAQEQQTVATVTLQRETSGTDTGNQSLQQQQVRMTLQREGEQWKLLTAEPLHEPTPLPTSS
ncbi:MULTISPECIES: hypothetical protein [unclassified Rothia (in: high G+C Gram-positive bacteria)]|uniref:hypothetical protein n=1 Tax=unclassified Rothia (in: high G+C Gram-positive bacteria) TaxID=2689056 RepID=UPI00195E5CB9|nr:MULTISPECIES: hypothetical protein [unclassified Rothia (in: high G+C Gram-positive bacteria)]MBM7050723.1 hypothetical protein [Rothia sp. ZJ1223]QRZ60908.1 hypothetical protein JR346_06430 [Rothia sp. ZJ932]